MLLIGTVDMQADDLYVVVHQEQGRTVFCLQQKPVVSFTDAGLKLVCDKSEVLYPLEKYLKFTIEDSYTETAVEGIESNSFSISDDEISASGCQCLKLFTSDGKLIVTENANENGIASVYIKNLEKGIYIVNAGDVSFKFFKK